MKKLVTLCCSALAAVLMVNSASAQPSSMGACLSVEIVDFDGNIVEAALATPELSTLVDAVVAAGLDEALATTENITVYAPTNDAFAAVPADILAVITGNVDLLTAVLTYHVTPSVEDVRRYSEAYARPTLQGQQVYLDRYGNTPRVNNAGASCQGVRANNGNVWIIDSVLLPNL